MGETKDVDLELVKRVQKGDKKAFDVLVTKYQHRVINLIGRYVNDYHETHDLAQESFLKAYRALPKFRAESAFYTWLYRIAINTAKNFLITRDRRPGMDIDIETAEQYENYGQFKDNATPESYMLKDEIEKTVTQAIENLPKDLRTAIIFREIEGMSYDAIANAMDCPVGTVRSRLFRAREAIDKDLQPLLES